MRIRKTVKKLLGSTIVYPSLTDSWAPPQPSHLLEASNASVDSASGEVCQLNQSPWDASPNLDLFTTACQDLKPTTKSKEEPVEKKKEETSKTISEKGGGILVNSTLKEENKTKPIRVCKREKKSTNKTNAETSEKTSEEILCKKNDGRKWFCKRPAQLPHSFCEYHVLQSRSYYTGLPPKPKKQKKDEERDKDKDKDKERDRSSSFFYYYEGFGPWRGKKRGERSNDEGDVRKRDDKEDQVILDGCDLPVAGVDEDDYDHEEEIVSSSNGTGEKKVGKKRGRKPIKCRSLKSLM